MLRTWSDKLRRRASDSPIATTTKRQPSPLTKNNTTEVEDVKLVVSVQSAAPAGSMVQGMVPIVSTSQQIHQESTRIAVPPQTIKTPIQELREELHREPNDNNRRLRTLLKSSLFRGHIPAEVRVPVWARLLGVKERDEADAELSLAIAQCARDLPNQRVIRVDVERTRVDLSQFREASTQDLLAQLLTYFCKVRACRYKQGLNEILAPFVYLVLGRDDAAPLAYRMWVAFLDRFAPHLYEDHFTYPTSDSGLGMVDNSQSKQRDASAISEIYQSTEPSSPGRLNTPANESPVKARATLGIVQARATESPTKGKTSKGLPSQDKKQEERLAVRSVISQSAKSRSIRTESLGSAPDSQSRLVSRTSSAAVSGDDAESPSRLPLKSLGVSPHQTSSAASNLRTVSTLPDGPAPKTADGLAGIVQEGRESDGHQQRPQESRKQREKAASEEMVALQCSFRFLEMLLLFHDPELWHLLEHNKLRPELYASAWLMTLLAQNVPMAQVLYIWESMLLADDALLVHFIALAFLCSNRNSFLSADPSDLPVLLTSRLSYHRRAALDSTSPSSGDPSSLVLLTETLRHALHNANELRKHTPDLLLWDMRRALFDKVRPPPPFLLRRLSVKLCATCSPEFFWMGITGRLEDSTEIIVVDCRPRREFDRRRARARLVFNVGVEVLESPDKLSAVLSDLRRHVLSVDASDPLSANVPSSLARAWRWHICVVGTYCRSILVTDEHDSQDDGNSDGTMSEASSSEDDDDNERRRHMDDDDARGIPSDVDGITGMCVLHLLKLSFPCVSVVEGGWDKLLATCPDRDSLLFPVVSSAPETTTSSVKEDELNLAAVSASMTNPSTRAQAYRRPRASHGDAVDDFDGPSFIVSRSSRGAPIKF